jgi:hypothetical protein
MKGWLKKRKLKQEEKNFKNKSFIIIPVALEAFK